MRKMILILIMAVAFAAASLLVPATASADHIKAPVCHNGETIEVDPSSLKAHITGHGDTLGPCVE